MRQWSNFFESWKFFWERDFFRGGPSRDFSEDWNFSRIIFFESRIFLRMMAFRGGPSYFFLRIENFLGWIFFRSWKFLSGEAFSKKNSKKILSHLYYFFWASERGGISIGNKKNYFFLRADEWGGEAIFPKSFYWGRDIFLGGNDDDIFRVQNFLREGDIFWGSKISWDEFFLGERFF